MIQNSNFGTLKSASAAVRAGSKPMQPEINPVAEPAVPVEPTYPKEINDFISLHQDFFPADKVETVRNKLMSMGDNWFVARNVTLRNPKNTKLLQLFGFIGVGGVGRLYIGDYVIGILQLVLPFCSMGIAACWSILDYFYVGKKTKEINCSNILRLI